MSPDLLYFKDFFDTLQHNEIGHVDSGINQFSQNISFSFKRTIRTKLCPNLAQNYSILYLMICHRDFFETFQHDQTQKVNNNNVSQFPRNPALVQLGNLSPFWAKIMQPYIASNCLMICSLRFLKFCHMMGFNIQTKAMLVSLPQKFPSRQGQLI